MEQADYYFERGRNKYEHKNYNGAIEDFSLAIKLNPNYDDAYFYRGDTKVSLGNLNGALEDYNIAIKLRPRYHVAYNNRGGIKSLLKDFSGAIDDYSNAIMLNQKYEMAFNNRGIIRIKFKDFNGAIMDFNNAIKLNPNYSEAYNSRANAKKELGDYNGAIEDFNRAINLNPDNEIPYNNRGKLKMILKDYIGAIDDFNCALELNPKDTNSVINRGTSKYELKDYINAIEDFNKVIMLNLDDGDAHYRRGNAKLKLKEYTDSIEDFDLAVKNNPKNSDAYVNRGLAKHELKDYTSAIYDYNRTLELNPLHPDVHNNRGCSKDELCDYTGAIDDFNQEIELNPMNAHAYYNRGNVEYKLKNFTGAIVDYKKAIEIDENFMSAYANIASLYGEIGNYQGAYENFVIVEELCKTDFELSHYSSKLMNFFSSSYTSFNAPFLLNRIINRIYTLKTFLSYQNLITTNLIACSNVKDVLTYIEKNKMIENGKFELLRGIVTYYMSDPSVSYKIFDEIIDTDIPDNLMGQYYFVLSCDDYLKSEAEPVRQAAIKRANEYLNDGKKIDDYLQLYYAGQIFFINQDYSEALECFLHIKDFIPSLCMQIICFDILKKPEDRDLLINELIVLDKHNKGLLQFVEIPKLNIDGFEESVMRYSHISEIQGVISILTSTTIQLDSLLYMELKEKVPNTIEVFSFDENALDGKYSIGLIKLWKKDVLNSFCNKFESYFNQEIKDEINIWNLQKDNNILEIQLGAYVPKYYLENPLNFNIIDIIDYFYIKGKLENEARYLLIGWVELYNYANLKLSKNQKAAIKYSVDISFGLILEHFGIKDYDFFFKILVLSGQTYAVDKFLDKLLHYIEDTLKENNSVPKTYTEFKKNFTAYLQVNEMNQT